MLHVPPVSLLPLQTTVQSKVDLSSLPVHLYLHSLAYSLFRVFFSKLPLSRLNVLFYHFLATENLYKSANKKIKKCTSSGLQNKILHDLKC